MKYLDGFGWVDLADNTKLVTLMSTPFTTFSSHLVTARIQWVKNFMRKKLKEKLQHNSINFRTTHKCFRLRRVKFQWMNYTVKKDEVYGYVILDGNTFTINGMWAVATDFTHFSWISCRSFLWFFGSVGLLNKLCSLKLSSFINKGITSSVSRLFTTG